MKTKTTYRTGQNEPAALAPSTVPPSRPAQADAVRASTPSPSSEAALHGVSTHHDASALYDASTLLTEVPAPYRGLLPPMPRPAQRYHAASVAELPAFLHHVCQEPDSPVVVVRFFSGRGGSQPVSIFRRPLHAHSSVYGGQVQVAPPPRALDLAGQGLFPRESADGWLDPDLFLDRLGPFPSPSARSADGDAANSDAPDGDAGDGDARPFGRWTVHPALPETFLEYMNDLGGRDRQSRDYDRMLVEEVLVAMATHRYSSAAYDQLGLYEVLAYDLDLEVEGHELWRWTSGWLFPINALHGEPDLGHSGGGLPRHYCTYGGQA